VATGQSVAAYTREKVSDQLAGIIQEMYAGEKKYSRLLEKLHPNFKQSGRNLMHYLILRSKEMREAQEYLHHIGLSSLTNSESHTLSQLQHVLSWLDPERSFDGGVVCDYEMASRLRQSNAVRLLGTFSIQDRPHIMVTLSVEMMDDPILMDDMLNEGMSVARINCAHDNAAVWLDMIDRLKKASTRTGKSCKIYMDLAGPKIRICAIGARRKADRLRLPVKEGTELYLRYAAHGRYGVKKHDKVPILYVEPKEILAGVKPGEHIYFDDGKFEARIVRVSASGARVRIERISTRKPYLKPEKGINLPDTHLEIPALTAVDKRNIPFICEYADMVGYSFVKAPEDIDMLRNHIDKNASDRKPSIILKIERQAAVHNLPALLLNGMMDEVVGIMIARGDLAVEIGFERLSEIQEEILWICEAAHVPVIWATQVLESMNKTGYATRSEITDAAMSGRAECVMLNKGRYIVKTIKMLQDILVRQLGQVNKKRYIMRPLAIARNFLQG